MWLVEVLHGRHNPRLMAANPLWSGVILLAGREIRRLKWAKPDNGTDSHD